MEVHFITPDLSTIIPEILLVIFASLGLLAAAVLGKEEQGRVAAFSIITTGITLVFALLPAGGSRVETFYGAVISDNFSVLFKVLFLLIAVMVMALSTEYLKIVDTDRAEFYPLVQFATVGMMIIASSGDLLTLYLGIELMSMSFYILATLMLHDNRSLEAGMKYFLTGILTSGLLLYGIALVFGATGSTNLARISSAIGSGTMVASAPNPLLILGIVMLIAGFGFKVATVPFHMWVPDVYEGAPTTVSIFLSVGSKAAAFAGMLRVFSYGLVHFQPDWSKILWVLAIVTMTVGNVVALKQTNLKRLLAYSSIAHAGYLLIGIIVSTTVGVASVMLYLVTYTFTNIGAFIMVILMCRKNNRGEEIADFSGLARSNPFIAFTFIIFALSLVGLPPTGGFIGKFYLFSSAIHQEFYWLAIIGFLNSVISLYYYFNVVMHMFMKDPNHDLDLSFSTGAKVTLFATAALTLLIGVFPEPLIKIAKASAESLVN